MRAEVKRGRADRAFRSWLWRIVAAGLLLAAALLAIVLVTRLLDEPSFVDALVVENPTQYDVRIQVTDSERSGWMSIGMARRAETSTFEQIIDQGEEWIFRFRAQGVEGGELRVRRSELANDDWRLRIPPASARSCRRAVPQYRRKRSTESRCQGTNGKVRRRAAVERRGGPTSSRWSRSRLRAVPSAVTVLWLDSTSTCSLSVRSSPVPALGGRHRANDPGDSRLLQPTGPHGQEAELTRAPFTPTRREKMPAPTTTMRRARMPNIPIPTTRTPSRPTAERRRSS